jgi:hypothetical protein
MSKPNWACSGCGMYSSRRWSVERHILNLHDGNSNVVSFVDYLVDRQSGFYLPKFRPTFVKKNATKTLTVMDTLKGELLKAVASKAVNNALSSSQMQNHQFVNFQGFDNIGAPTSILINLSLCILFQGLKTYSDSRYTLAKNAHL